MLARALKNLYPDSKLAIGPTIDNGFYYDVECSTTISIDDLEKIEMKCITLLNLNHLCSKAFIKIRCSKCF